MTITVDLNTFDAAASFPQFTAGQLAASLGTPDEPYTVRVVDKYGTILAALSDLDPENPNQAWPEDIVETINQPLDFAITFPKYAFTKADVDILGQPGQDLEIQVLLGPEVLAWGPAIAENGGSSSPSVTLQCKGPDWYFQGGKRAIDQEEVNLLSYGGFEAGDFTGWRTSGAAFPGPGGGTIGDGVVAEIETDNVFQGTYAARLTAAFAPTGLGLASNPVSFTAGPLGNVLALTWSSCVELFLTPALYNAGVMLIAGPAAANGAPQGGVNAKWARVWRLDSSTPVGIEERHSLQVRIPANKTWAVQVLVFAPAGITVYDHFFLAPHRKLDTQSFTGSPTATVDVSRIARMIFEHTLSDVHHHNKSDLAIGLDCPSCGVRQARKYEFIDHIPVDQAFNEFLDRDDCFEYAVDFTTTTRTLRLEPIDPAFNPRGESGLGTDYGEDVRLTYPDTQGPVSGFTTAIDGGSVVTQVTATGDGDGLTREEQWDEDATKIGGTTLQGLVQAPTDSPFNSLLPLARGTRKALDDKVTIIEVTLTRDAGGYIPDDTVLLVDLLRLGDRLTLDITDGWHTYDGLWRIIRRVRHCRARTFTYTLNRVPA